MANLIGGKQGNTGTVIIGKNPIIDNPLDPWWDIQGAVNSGASAVNSAAGTVNTVSNAVNTASSVASGAGNVFSDLTNPSLWKGIGLILAGGLILIFAAYEFAHLAGVSSAPVPIPV